MKLKSYILMMAAVAVAASSAKGQNLLSGYFDDNYNYRYQLNPAMGNDDNGFVSMPGLGNLNASTHGTIGVSKVLYNIDGETTTFLNPKVDANEFVNGLHNKNRVGVDLRETILAVGFKGLWGYNTVTLSARANVGVYIPKDLLRLAKLGAENDVYHIGKMGAQATAWAELALNHSQRLSDQWRVGASAKLLIGGGNIDARFHNTDLVLGTDNWTATVDAELNNSVKHLNYKTDYNDRTGRHYVSGFDYGDFDLAGIGAAFDFGAVFTLNRDWEFSASLLDLGFIVWDQNNLATTNGPQQVETDRYTFNVTDMDDAFDKLRDDVTMLYQLSDAGNQGTRTTMLGATLNLAAQYKLPVYRRLSFGLLNQTRIQGAYSWTDFRLSANVTPVDCFSASVNLGVGTFGASFGWLLNFKTTGFNLFLASDVTPGKLAKQGVPLNSNANFNIGINFPF